MKPKTFICSNCKSENICFDVIMAWKELEDLGKAIAQSELQATKIISEAQRKVIIAQKKIDSINT